MHSEPDPQHAKSAICAVSPQHTPNPEMQMFKKRTFKGQDFFLMEILDSEFDAHDAAHVYRAHEGLLCRVIPTRGDDGEPYQWEVYAGPDRTNRETCKLRWCPMNEFPAGMVSTTFFVPTTHPIRFKEEVA